MQGLDDLRRCTAARAAAQTRQDHHGPHVLHLGTQRLEVILRGQAPENRVAACTMPRKPRAAKQNGRHAGAGHRPQRLRIRIGAHDA